MRTVQSSDVAGNFNSPHRSDAIGFARLLQGDPAAPDNHEFSLVKFGAGYTTPRHHHNFDQIHYVLEGFHAWAPDRVIAAGHVAYFPEGSWYGPQLGSDGVVLGLQFGGANGVGFMDYDSLRSGSERLAETGEFVDGSYRSTGTDGAVREVDGYEAVWEHVRGRPVEYPPARYAEPIVMDTAAFGWVPSRDEPGVEHKHLLTVTERRVAVGFSRLAAGAEHHLGPLAATRVQHLLAGEVVCNQQRFGAGTAFSFEVGDTVAMMAETDSELYWIDLPQFSLSEPR